MFMFGDFYRRSLLSRVAKTQIIKLVLTVGLTSVILSYFASLEDELELGDDGYIDITKYRLIEPIVKDDFPVLNTNRNMDRIPKIIHQTWRDAHVPDKFKENIESFVDNNPGFEYYFWTDESARRLLADRHPYLLKTFDRYVEPVRKADLLRYVVLYEFGGVYADLDTKCIRPLGRIIENYACVLSKEPDVHAALIFNTDWLITNSVMFCRPKHPFLLKLMKSLPLFSILATDIDSSGPNYLTLQLTSYLEDREHLDLLDNDAVFIAPSQYFQNNLDPVRYGQFRKLCREFSKLNDIGKRGCVSLKVRGFYRKRTKYTFTEHHFFHTGLKIVPVGRYSIKMIVPHAKMYKSS